MTNIKMLRRALCLALTGFLFVANASAQGWSGKGEAGLVKASGNTENESFNVALGFTKGSGVWAHELGVGFYQASADGIDSADSIFADYTIKRDLSDRRFVFGGLNYLDDDFDGFTEQTSISAGYGYRVILDDPNLWEVALGVGYRDTAQAIRLDDGTEIEGEDVSGPTVVLTSKFVRQITANTQFRDDFRSDIGADNTFIENDAALVVAMNDAFSLKAGLLVRYNSDPAPGADDTDTITSLNLVYNFAR